MNSLVHTFSTVKLTKGVEDLNKEEIKLAFSEELAGVGDFKRFSALTGIKIGTGESIDLVFYPVNTFDQESLHCASKETEDLTLQAACQKQNDEELLHDNLHFFCRLLLLDSHNTETAVLERVARCPNRPRAQRRSDEGEESRFVVYTLC